MISLKESILSSTKSGRYIHLTDEYIISKGAVQNKNVLLYTSDYKGGKQVHDIYKYKDNYLITIFNDVFQGEIIIKYQNDLDILILYWDLLNQLRYSKNKKLEEEVYKVFDKLLKQVEIKEQL